MRHAVIVGAGISGLTAAWRLKRLAAEAQIPLRVTLLESMHRPGGSIRTEREKGFLLEGGPDSFLSIKPWARELCMELGLEDQLAGTNEACRQSFIVRSGKLVPVPEGFYMVAPGRLRTFAGTKLLSLPGKIRALGDLFLPRRGEAGDESVAGFITRRFGREVLENIGQPMIAGIYSADPERLSLRATFPVFQDMERENRSIILALRKKMAAGRGRGTSGPRYSMFLTLRDGLQVLVDRLAAEIGRDDLRCNTAVESIRRDSRWRIIADGREFDADALCLAVPPPAAARLLAPVEPGLIDALGSIPYASVATAALAWKKSSFPDLPRGFGFVVPRHEKGVLTGCTFSSIKYAGRAPEDSVLLRAFLGESRCAGLAEAADEDILKAVREDLALYLGVRDRPLIERVWKWKESMPQYHVGHAARVAGLEAAAETVPGLFLAGNGYSGIGIPDCVRQARATAEKMMRYLERGAGHAAQAARHG